MKWNDKDRTLTINDRQGNYKGMLKNRKFNIIIVEPGKGCGDGDATTFDQSVSYRGKSRLKIIKFQLYSHHLTLGK